MLVWLTVNQYTKKKNSGNLRTMMSKNPPKYALEFFGKSILLLSSDDDTTWSEIGLADMGDPDFREMMKDFLAEVSAHGLRPAKVAMFLPIDDVIVATVKNADLEATLENQSQCKIEELAYVAGLPLADETQNVLYAYRETLQEAQKFVAQFGFSASYFSARLDLDGFISLPKISLHSQKPKAFGKLRLPYVAAAATVVIGAFSLWALSNNAIRNDTAGNVPPSFIEETIDVAKASASPMILASHSTPATFVDQQSFVPETSFDAKELPLQPFSMKVPTKLEELETPQSQAMAPLPILSELGLEAEIAPIEQVAFVVSEQSDLIERPLDQIASVVAPIDVENMPAEIDRAVPEGANYPRPKLRSGTRETVEVVTVPAQIPTAPASGTFARPKHRPSGVMSAKPSTTTTTQAAIAEDLLQQAIKEDTVASNSLKNASRLAAGNTKRPPMKASSFRQQVAAVNKQPTKPAKVTTKTTTVATTAVSKPATAPAPSSDEKSTRASTTFSKNSLSLIGVFGTSSRRNALFRTSTGGYRSAKIGQRVSGWKIVAIGESSVKVSKGSRSKTMRVPQ
jgi:hypothetical protein